MKDLFVWQKLTGQLLYTSNDTHKRPWEELSGETHFMFNEAAKVLNRRLSLCGQCGERAPLIWDGICRNCTCIKKVWKHLCRKARAKGYEIYCGRYERQFSILGHHSGWPIDWSACYEGVLRACFWLDQQGDAVSEEERMEARRVHWEEQKLIESNEPYIPDDQNFRDLV